jgi:hypothetical protein
MKKRIQLILFYSCLCTVFAFGETITLEDALKRKWLSAKIIIHYGSEKIVHLSATNLTKEARTVLVPVGFIFQAADSSFQDFIHLDNSTFQIAAYATQSVSMGAMCIRANRRGPTEGLAFLPTTVASGHLLALTTFALAQKLQNEDSMQSALWAITNNHDLTGISNQVLAKFVAQRLGKPLPDYFVNYKTRVEPNLVAETALEPLAITGLFQYTLAADQQVKLDLVDTTGRSVLSDYNLVQTMNQTKGRHRFTFNLKLTGIPRGTYFVKMLAVSGGKEWGSKQVVF